MFQCPECENLLDRRDIDLDGMQVWGVAADGTLSTTTDPAHSLDCLMGAIEEFLTSEECPNAEYARHVSALSATEFLAAYIDARRLGIKRPEFGYTEETIRDAVNAGADMILGVIDLSEAAEDAISLVVNAALALLKNPEISFVEMIEENYSEDADEVLSWWGWNK
ncbi:hypothetical protein [Streptomyces sp. NPDC046976]|uniref:hypothetical protein n=1 Tax=Streptomyces sp. NPDC046976 TaxID=3155258 RepID=UPI0033D7A270